MQPLQALPVPLPLHDSTSLEQWRMRSTLLAPSMFVSTRPCQTEKAYLFLKDRHVEFSAEGKLAFPFHGNSQEDMLFFEICQHHTLISFYATTLTFDESTNRVYRSTQDFITFTFLPTIQTALNRLQARDHD